MWIRLHFYGSEDEIWIQTQNICAVYPDQREKYKNAMVIQFSGSEENYIQVKETIDEIGAMITE